MNRFQQSGVTTSGAQTRTATAIATDSRLLSDLVLTDDILVDTAAGPVAVFQNAQGQSEALIIHSDGLLYHVYRETGASGWNVREVGGGMQATEVVADRFVDGTIQALFAGPQGNLYGIGQDVNGAWSAPASANCQLSQLGLMAKLALDPVTDLAQGVTQGLGA